MSLERICFREILARKAIRLGACSAHIAMWALSSGWSHLPHLGWFRMPCFMMAGSPSVLVMRGMKYLEVLCFVKRMYCLMGSIRWQGGGGWGCCARGGGSYLTPGHWEAEVAQVVTAKSPRSRSIRVLHVVFSRTLEQRWSTTRLPVACSVFFWVWDFWWLKVVVASFVARMRMAVAIMLTSWYSDKRARRRAPILLAVSIMFMEVSESVVISALHVMGIEQMAIKMENSSGMSEDLMSRCVGGCWENLLCGGEIPFSGPPPIASREVS
jgi:hypothetical protein